MAGTTRTSTWHDLPTLIVHIPLALIAAPALSFILSLLLGYSFPYGPSIIAGAALGFLVNRKLRNLAACWVGVLPVVGLALLILHWHSGYESSAYYRERTGDSYWVYLDEELFTTDSNKCANSECLGELIFTMPVVSAIAYSIGAILALRLIPGTQAYPQSKVSRNEATGTTSQSSPPLISPE